jgi:two-component system OmpR family response regulator
MMVRRATWWASDVANRVLVIEDDPDAQFIYASCLRHAGFDVAAAGSARDGAEAAHKVTPHLVVLDRRLPDRDGLDLARQWRASSRMARIPIIALTSYTTRTDVEAALVAGCDAFLAKPCPGSVLVAHVMKLLISSAPTQKLAKLRK